MSFNQLDFGKAVLKVKSVERDSKLPKLFVYDVMNAKNEIAMTLQATE